MKTFLTCCVLPGLASFTVVLVTFRVFGLELHNRIGFGVFVLWIAFVLSYAIEDKWGK